MPVLQSLLAWLNEITYIKFILSLPAIKQVLDTIIIQMTQNKAYNFKPLVKMVLCDFFINIYLFIYL
jgi:hypothetical protein